MTKVYACISVCWLFFIACIGDDAFITWSYAIVGISEIIAILWCSSRLVLHQPKIQISVADRILFGFFGISFFLCLLIEPPFNVLFCFLLIAGIFIYTLAKTGL